MRWFNKLDFNTLKKREDVYPNLKKEDFGIKLREGYIEIKHHVGTRAKGCLSPKAWGCFEIYVKWSFSAKENDPLYEEVTRSGYEEWVSVKKRRNMVQLSNENRKLVVGSPSIVATGACQLEYTGLEVNEKRWYTFGLEWSDNNRVKIESEFISKILGDSALRCKQSMGYAEFLSKNAVRMKSPALY